MNTITKNIEGIFSQNKAQLYFFLGIGIIFSGLTIWMFLFRQDIPDKLMNMTMSIWGFLWAGIAKGKDKLETLLNKDLDGDGSIGASSDSTTTNQVETSVPETVIESTTKSETESEPYVPL